MDRFWCVGLVLAVFVAGPLTIGSASACTTSVRSESATASYFNERLAEAEKGQTSAMLEVGLAYRDGLGVERDRVRAYVWLNLAARGEREAPKLREKLKRCMTGTEITAAETESLRLLTGSSIQTAVGR